MPILAIRLIYPEKNGNAPQPNQMRISLISKLFVPIQRHQRQVEKRLSDISGLVLPNWENVKNREYHPWSSDRIIIDTANKTPDECFYKLEKKPFI